MPSRLRRQARGKRRSSTQRGTIIRNGENRASAESGTTIDVEGALARWGDTVLRLALCRTGNLADAEDVTQAVFLKLCERTASFESDEHLKAWLLRVTMTCSVDLARSQRTCACASEDELRHALDAEVREHENAPLANALETERQAMCAAAVASLPEKQRMAVHLRYYEDLSSEEIARITGEKASTVRSHLFRARAALRERMTALRPDGQRSERTESMRRIPNAKGGEF